MIAIPADLYSFDKEKRRQPAHHQLQTVVHQPAHHISQNHNYNHNYNYDYDYNRDRNNIGCNQHGSLIHHSFSSFRSYVQFQPPTCPISAEYRPSSASLPVHSLSSSASSCPSSSASLSSHSRSKKARKRTLPTSNKSVVNSNGIHSNSEMRPHQRQHEAAAISKAVRHQNDSSLSQSNQRKDRVRTKLAHSTSSSSSSSSSSSRSSSSSSSSSRTNPLTFLVSTRSPSSPSNGNQPAQLANGLLKPKSLRFQSGENSSAAALESETINHKSENNSNHGSSSLSFTSSQSNGLQSLRRSSTNSPSSDSSSKVLQPDLSSSASSSSSVTSESPLQLSYSLSTSHRLPSAVASPPLSASLETKSELYACEEECRKYEHTLQLYFERIFSSSTSSSSPSFSSPSFSPASPSLVAPTVEQLENLSAAQEFLRAYQLAQRNSVQLRQRGRDRKTDQLDDELYSVQVMSVEEEKESEWRQIWLPLARSIIKEMGGEKQPTNNQPKQRLKKRQRERDAVVGIEAGQSQNEQNGSRDGSRKLRRSKSGNSCTTNPTQPSNDSTDDLSEANELSSSSDSASLSSSPHISRCSASTGNTLLSTRTQFSLSPTSPSSSSAPLPSTSSSIPPFSSSSSTLLQPRHLTTKSGADQLIASRVEEEQDEEDASPLPLRRSMSESSLPVSVSSSAAFSNPSLFLPPSATPCLASGTYPYPWYNYVNTDPPPAFLNSTTNEWHPSAHKPNEDEMLMHSVGCDCFGGKCNPETCECNTNAADDVAHYDGKGRVKSITKTGVYLKECNAKMLVQERYPYSGSFEKFHSNSRNYNKKDTIQGKVATASNSE